MLITVKACLQNTQETNYKICIKKARDYLTIHLTLLNLLQIKGPLQFN